MTHHQQNGRIPLGFAQTSMNSVHKLYPDSKSNDRSVAVKINGAVNETALYDAFFKLSERHDVLRSCIDQDNPALIVQPITKMPRLPLQFIDATRLHPAPAIENTCHTLKVLDEENFIEDRFPLETGPLWRAALIKYTNNEYHLVMLFNHIIVDEASIGNIFQDLSAYYNASLNKTAAQLKSLPPLTQVDFSIPEEEKQLRMAYWQWKLNDLNQVNLATDTRPQKRFPFPGKRLSFRMDGEPLREFHEKNKNYSNNVILLTCFYMLLHLLTNENDICVGITSSNRRNEKIGDENMKRFVNAFFNSIPLRVKFDKDTTIVELLERVKSTQSHALKSQLPFDLVWDNAISLTTKSALTSASPFNFLLVLNEKKPTLSFINTTAEYPVELDLGQCKMQDFGVNIDELYDESFRFTIEYNTDRFNTKTIQDLFARFTNVLESMCAGPQKKIADMSVLLPEELTLIENLNHASIINNTKPVFLHDQLRHLALTSPTSPAIEFHNEDGTTNKITYGDLDASSTLLANHLTECGVTTETPIGVCLPRSIELYVAIFAVLKAGGILVPLDKNANDVAYKIKDSGTQTVICNSADNNLLETICPRLINIDDRSWASTANPVYMQPDIQPENPAYIIYTSGTSGLVPEPKGVICTREGLSNLLAELLKQANNRKLSNPAAQPLKILSTALPTFDAFLYDIVKMLAEGGTLHLTYNKGRLAPVVIQYMVRNYGIDFAALLPAIMKELDPSIPLKHIISMGDAPCADVIKRWLLARDRTIENGYGPTETTICASSQVLQADQNQNLIGKPIANTQMLILHPENHTLCPVNVPGEIFITGKGVANGYLHNPDKSAQKFIWMAWDKTRHAYVHCDRNDTTARKFFASGDYGCYKRLDDNTLTIEFMGRKDRQLKIWGVRIDLNTIEAALHSLAFVKDMVLAPDSEHTGLITYIVANTPITEDEMQDEVRKLISTSLLPSIAYPKAVIKVPAIPVTANGKPDLRKLSQLAVHNVSAEPANKSALQNQLIQLFSAALGCPAAQIKTNKSFEELGGKSLALLKLAVALNSNLDLRGYALTTNILTRMMTIESLEQQLIPLLDNNQMIQTPNVTHIGKTMMVFRKPKKPVQNTPQNAGKEQIRNVNL